jgi:hypothetical protein
METARQLVGRQVLRNFGKHGIHKGAITSFDDDGELTFRVEYKNGDSEDLSEADVRQTLIDKGIVRVSSRLQRDKDAYKRVGTSVDAVVLLEVVKHNGLVYDTLQYEMACVYTVRYNHGDNVIYPVR